VLYPGDELYIPDKALRSESAATGQRHTFLLSNAQARLVIKVAEYTANPLEGWPYTLKIGGAETKANVPSSGVIEHAIPIGLREADLKVHFNGDSASASSYHWQLRIGELDPVDTVSGLQARLNNLGFYAGSPASEINPTIRTAVRQFQRAYGLLVDEIPGPKTQAKLVEIYGC
jgi:N-acetylmuramoyl-L-alanine amidase